MSRPQALKRAREVLRELEETVPRYTQSEFFEKTLERCYDLAPTALEGCVIAACQDAERERSQQRKDRQTQPLLPGCEFLDEGGIFKLGNGERVFIRHARIEDYRIVLAEHEEQFYRHREKLARMREVYDLLLPYWTGERELWEACAAYKAAQGDAA